MRFVFALGLCLAAGAAWAEPVTLTARDGVKVFGEVWRAAVSPVPVILAFHQAASNHAEYAPLAPRLNRAGFTVLAIDQRSGGPRFGAPNRTAAALGSDPGFEAALPDLEAALAWGRTAAAGKPVLVWGSSYSAALVFLLAARHPGEVAGVLAFSPGEYLSEPAAVHDAARRLSVPVFIDQARDGGEIAEGRSILAAAGSAVKVQFVPAIAGIHGASTLRADSDPRGAEENWAAVLAFLGRFGGTAAAPL
jgi:dienelactone hydrolase